MINKERSRSSPFAKATNKGSLPVKEKRKNAKKVTFSIPEEEIEMMESLIIEMMKMGIKTNKSESIRAGVKLLSSLSMAEKQAVFESVEKLVPGRKK